MGGSDEERRPKAEGRRPTEREVGGEDRDERRRRKKRDKKGHGEKWYTVVYIKCHEQE